MPSTNLWDAIVIGAGHNGLTAAGYLAKSGKRVLVLERRDVVGGAVLTEEFHPGFRNSAAAYVVSLLRPEVIEELELRRHGFETLRMGGSFGAFADGKSLLLTGDENADRAEVARFSNRDWEAMASLGAMLRKAGDLVRAEMLEEPPRLSGGGLADLLGGLRLGRGLKRFSPAERHQFLQLFLTPVGAILDRTFDSDAVKTMYAATATAGAFVSLDEPGSAINLLHLGIGEVESERGAWHLPKGGMGTVTQSMAKAAQSFGAEIRVSAPVETILIEAGRAVGARLESGEEIRARAILSNADPKRTFLGLVGEKRLPPEFAAGIQTYRMASGSFRINFALSGLPEFASRPGAAICPQHRAFIRMVSGYAAYDEAFRAAKRGELPADPILDAVIPTAIDPSLAPPGCHILSILAQHYPYRLAHGRAWEQARGEAVEGILAAAERYIPNIRKLVLGWRAYSPHDLERVFGLTGGDVYHGQLDPGQIFSLRPHPAAAQYRTPVKALYLCGAGAHPGGGVSGAPGRNAAMRVLKDWRRL